MAVRQTNQWQPNPGRAADTIAAFSEAKAIHERLGSRARAWQSIAAGAGPVTFLYTLESDTIADHMIMLGKLRGDAQWQSLVQRVLAVATPPAVQVSSVIATEIPGFEAGVLTAAPGTLVASVAQWRVQPGRMADFIAHGHATKALAVDMGATLSVWLNTYAGAGAGIAGVAFIFNGYAELAAYQQKAAANAAWQANLQTGRAADAPVTIVSSALLAEIPI